MNSPFNLVFQVEHSRTHKIVGEIDIDVGRASGAIECLWINGYDHSDDGQSIELILKLIGSNNIAAMCSEIATKENL